MIQECFDVATTSIWKVEGWLGKVVIYVENPEKTVAPESVKFPENHRTLENTQSLSDVIAYAVNEEKTRRKEQEGKACHGKCIHHGRSRIFQFHGGHGARHRPCAGRRL